MGTIITREITTILMISQAYWKNFLKPLGSESMTSGSFAGGVSSSRSSLTLKSKILFMKDNKLKVIGDNITEKTGEIKYATDGPGTAFSLSIKLRCCR